MKPGCAQCGAVKDWTGHVPDRVEQLYKGDGRFYEHHIPNPGFSHHFKPRTALNELAAQVDNVCALGRGDKVPRLNKDGTVMSVQMERAKDAEEKSKMMDALMKDKAALLDKYAKRDSLSAHVRF